MANSISKTQKEIAAKLSKLSFSEKLLVKSCNSSLSSIKLTNPTLASELTTLREEIEQVRILEKESMEHELNSILQELIGLKKIITDEHVLQSIKPADMREKLLNIQKRIICMKQNIERVSSTLREEEKALWLEVGQAQRRLDEGELHCGAEQSARHTCLARARAARTSTSDHPKHPDVEQFEKFKSERGATGGWEEADHLFFLRQIKYQKQGKFYQTLQSQLPDMNVEKIKEHEDWFRQYEILKAKYKIAIEHWKNDKLARKVKCKDERSDSLRTDTSISTAQSNTTTNNEKRMKIEEWKKQRKLKQEVFQQELKLLKEKEDAKLKMSKIKQEQLKTLVIQHRHKKIKEKEAIQQDIEIKEKQAKREKALQARKLLKTFRQLDELHVERQRVLRESACRPVVGALPRVTAGAQAARDPHRLLRDTQVWQAHCRKLQQQEPGKPLLHLSSMPRLAVPTWRKQAA